MYVFVAPVAPTSVSATDVTSNSLKVTWVRPSPQYLVTHYRLEKWSAESSWELVDDTIKEQLYSVFRLSAFTIYQFRLKGVNGLGTSNYSMTSGNVSTLSSSKSKCLTVVYWSLTEILSIDRKQIMLFFRSFHTS